MHDTLITLPDRPTAIAHCQRCGRPIKYYVWHDKEQTMPVRPPTYCKGVCTEIMRGKKTQKQVERAKKLRREE